jgi:hypothetical protein
MIFSMLFSGEQHLLAVAYARLNALQLKAMMGNRALMEICRDETIDLQK